MNQESQDLECIQQIRSGGKQRADGITTLYRKYAPQLKHFFFRRGKTGILPHCPFARSVHIWVDSAGEGVGSRRPELLFPIEI